MRIVSWNCNGGFGKKSSPLRDLATDLCIIQEISRRDLEAIDAPFTHWIGVDPNKGLAVISFTDTPQPQHIFDSCPLDLPLAIPLVFGDLHVLAVWACVHDNKLRYVRVLHKMVDRYRDFLSSGPSLVIGDLNSNAIWDGKYGERGHSGIVTKLEAAGLVSLYHHQSGEIQGEETIPTFYLYRHQHRPFHLDHAFISKELARSSALVIGSPDEWLARSDHLPLILDVT